MSFTYKPLRKLLIDRDMTKKELMERTGISKSTMDKMSSNKLVAMEIVDRICNYFECNIEDVVAHCPDKEI